MIRERLCLREQIAQRSHFTRVDQSRKQFLVEIRICYASERRVTQEYLAGAMFASCSVKQ